MRRFSWVLLLWCAGFAPGNCSSSEMLAQYGYTEMRPPNSFLEPGTLILIESKNPFSASVICSAASSLGSHVKTLQSTTSSGRLAHINNKSYRLDVNALKQSQGDSFQEVESMVVTLKNTRIVELTDEAVIVGMKHRSRECSAAVSWRVSQGYTITMVSSALYADLDYDVGYSRKLTNKTSAPLKEFIVSDIAASLEGSTEIGNTGRIVARGLIVGLKDSEYLSALAIPYIEEQMFSKDTKHLPHKIPATVSGSSIQAAPDAALSIQVIDVDRD